MIAHQTVGKNPAPREILHYPHQSPKPLFFLQRQSQTALNHATYKMVNDRFLMRVLPRG